MNAVAAAASATDSVVYSCPAANANGSVWLSTVVSAWSRRLIVGAMANALSATSAISTTPLTRMRPGVVIQNHQRGWVPGSTGACDGTGSVEGCASSNVTGMRPSSSRSPPMYKRILREDSTVVPLQRSACPNAAYPETVRGDGDGWVLSETGAMFWGRHGAAGLLLRAP